MNAKQTLRQATLAKWSAIFQEQQSSGLTIKEWCSQNDVSLHNFYYWKRIAKEEYLKSVMPEIVPISIPSDPIPVVPAPEASASTEELELYNFNNSNNTASVPEASAPTAELELYNFNNSSNTAPAVSEASAPAEQLELYNFNNSCNSSNTAPTPVPISISMGDIKIEIGASAPDALITKIIGALRNA